MLRHRETGGATLAGTRLSGTGCCAVLYFIVLCCAVLAMLYCAVLYFIVMCCAVPCCAVLYRDVLCRADYAVLCCAVLYRDVLCWLCCTVLCHPCRLLSFLAETQRAVACLVLPYQTVPFRSVPCRAVPYHTIPYHTIPYRRVYHTIPCLSADESPQLLRGSAHSLDGALRSTFVPEYCVRAITEVYYLKIRRSHYVAARKATMVAAQRDPARPVDHSDSLAHDMAALVSCGPGYQRAGTGGWCQPALSP